MIKQFAHVCLMTGKLQESKRFYGEKLGLPIKFTFEKDGKVCGIYFDTGAGTFIEVFEEPGLIAKNTGIVHFCLETNDIDTLISSLRESGIQCSDKKLGCDKSYQAWVQDPDGNKIEFHEYTEESFQKKGGVIRVP
ncbi:MAG: hypothetical protein A2X49_10045 [Lentisphaerae bacterium GWF2_52_8]|nr:MAG: hypothetical protein A2X49_10045 [Lentisphaerae bacterium GWF2_52_8]